VQNGKKDRLDRIEALVEANTKGLVHTRELLDMAAAQTIENHKLIKDLAKGLANSRREHDREMKEIRGLFKQMIRRIAI
jgi:hypothetical protein